jgi:hypothetical protein
MAAGMRSLRKHRAALLSLAAFLFVFFFPTFFMGRVLSPNDIIRSYDPWATAAPLTAQNSTLNDIPTSYFTLMSLLQRDPSAFHWNRFIASGVPGFASAGAAVITPLVSLPVLLLPEVLEYSGIVVMKLLVAFWFGYLWLRVERMGKKGAAAGAMVMAGAGVIAVWWLWPATNAIALYPALFFFAALLARGKQPRFLVVALVVLSLALSGRPVEVLYGACFAVLYFAIEAVRIRRIRPAPVLMAVGAAATALLIAAPFVAPFLRLLRVSGYLEGRSGASSQVFYPLEHLAAFFRPYRLGDPIAHFWLGDGRLGPANNFVETTLFAGISVLVLAVAGLASGRASRRFFWAGALAVIIAGMFGFAPIAKAIAVIPGIEYSPLTRLRFLLPLPLGYLAAAGLMLLRKRRLIATVVVAAVAVELGLFAAHFHPYLQPKDARVPATPTIEFLQSRRPPFRVLPFFFYLFPNTSELFAIEDVRSHFTSELRYRQMLQQVEPQSFGQFGTILIFNSLHTRLDHPFLRLLGVRYLVEQPSIDILRWGVDKGAATVHSGPTAVKNGQHVDVPFTLAGSGHRLVEVRVSVGGRAGGSLTMALLRPETGETVSSATSSAADLRTPKMYLRLPRDARPGSVWVIRIRATELDASVEEVRVTPSNLFLLRELPDGKVFENVTALPRYWAVWEGRRLPFERFLQDGNFDPEREAVFETDMPEIAPVAPGARSARIQLLEYGGTSDHLRVTAAAPFILSSSEKSSPDLRVTVDGKTVRHYLANGIFTAVPIPAGTHTVRFERRAGRGLWPLFAVGLVMLVMGAIIDRRGVWRR